MSGIPYLGEVFRDEIDVPGKFFNLQPKHVQETFMGLLRRRSYPRNFTLFREGEGVKGIHLVLSGTLRMSVSTQADRRLNLYHVEQGDLLGCLCAVANSPYLSTAETVHPVILAEIGQEAFRSFLQQHPMAYQALRGDLTRENSMAFEKLRIVGLTGLATQRLGRLFLDRSSRGELRDESVKLRLAMTRDEIAECIGTSREAVCRALRWLEENNLILLRGATVTIPSKAALSRFVVC
jgi:CRP-like cAMP-binding protein